MRVLKHTRSLALGHNQADLGNYDQDGWVNFYITCSFGVESPGSVGCTELSAAVPGHAKVGPWE
jgi:uncharacterized protein YcsI (UPF0317 family)